jgi:hypothetical protein
MNFNVSPGLTVVGSVFGGVEGFGRGGDHRRLLFHRVDVFHDTTGDLNVENQRVVITVSG